MRTREISWLTQFTAIPNTPSPHQASEAKSQSAKKQKKRSGRCRNGINASCCSRCINCRYKWQKLLIPKPSILGFCNIWFTITTHNDSVYVMCFANSDWDSGNYPAWFETRWRPQRICCRTVDEESLDNIGSCGGFQMNEMRWALRACLAIVNISGKFWRKIYVDEEQCENWFNSKIMLYRWFFLLLRTHQNESATMMWELKLFST